MWILPRRFVKCRKRKLLLHHDRRQRQTSLRVEPLEARCLLHADLVISELVASNATGLLDFQGNDSDWFEIHNRGPSRVDLRGWFVTDDANRIDKWRIPVSTVIGPEERLVLFASNNDLVAPNGELHTNFKLTSNGEFLALIDPGGTIIHSYSPAFPSQTTDVSFGIDENFRIFSLVGQDALATALVPIDNSLGSTWTGGNEPFDDGSWIVGTTGIGFETATVGAMVSPPIAYWTFDQLEHGGTVAPDQRGRYDGTVVGATITTDSGGRFGEALSLDGDDDYVDVGIVDEIVNPRAISISLWFRRDANHAGVIAETNHEVNNVLITNSSPISNDTLEIGTEADFVELYLDTEELGGAIPPVRAQANIQNDIWHHLVATYDKSDPLETKIYVDGVLVNEQSAWGGLISDSANSPLTIGLARPGTSAKGDFEGLIDDVAIWDAALDAAQVSALFGGNSPLLLSGYTPHISLDLETELFSQNRTALIRVPFMVSDPGVVDLLRLGMKYDDAFVAFVNGQEVARGNFSGTPAWNSAADNNRPDSAALVEEEFLIPIAPGLLQAGDNILAIQVSSESAAAERVLASPVLDAIELFYGGEVLLDEGATGTVLVPSNGTLGTTWTGGAEPFDDSGWTGGTTGVGYDLSPGDTALSPVEVATVLGGPTPLVYWTFDELSEGGRVAPDQQGNYDGAVVGAGVTRGNRGRFGEALALDGDDDYLSAGLIPELVNPAALSVSVWFQRSANHTGSISETNYSVNNVLIANSSSTDNGTLEIGTEDDFIEIYLNTDELDDGIPSVRTQAAIQNDTWHHLVFTYDSQDAQEAKIYVDGALVNVFSQYSGLVSPSSGPLTIGLACPGASSLGDFEGLIDDVAIWDAALSAQQVAALFPVPAPLSYWKFDKVSSDVSVVADTQGNYDSVVTGATVTAGGQGRFGEAFSFDGDDDSVSTGVVAELVNPAAFSASIWFQRTVDHAGTSAETNHEVNNVLMAHSSHMANDSFEIGTEGDFIEIYLDTEQLGGSIPPVRVPAGVQNGVWHHLVMTYDSLETEELKVFLDGSLVSALSAYGGLISNSSSPLSLGLAKPGDLKSGAFEGLIDDVAIWEVALDGQQVASLFAGDSPLITTGRSYLPQIGTNLQNQLHNQHRSTYLRLPFTVDNPASILSLELDVKYDDAFVAYINGTEVARGNLTGAPVWNSLADTDRADRTGFEAKHFVITNPAELLFAGNNILGLHAVNAATDAERFLILPELSAKVLPGHRLSYIETPTPGTVNNDGLGGLLGKVEDTQFSVDRGFYDAPFDVTITTATSDSTILYTTNGSPPEVDNQDNIVNGTVYTGPISISTTTTLRALAFKPDFLPTNVDTHSYFFISDLINQPAFPDGFPIHWDNFPADYELDPEVTADPQYNGLLDDSFRSLPAVSLVMPVDDWFDAESGIYANPDQTGEFWERAVSMELIYADGRDGFQVDAGVQIQGGSSNLGWKNDKVSMRVLFKEIYGPTKLNFKLFDDSPVDSFNTLLIDAQSNYTWTHPSAAQQIRSDYIRDQYVSDLQLAMQREGPHGLYTHLFINGLYWGMYNVHERPDHEFNASYYGGQPEDYDVIKHHNFVGDNPQVVRGSLEAWNTALAMANAGLANDQAYQDIQHYIDVPNLIDYLLANFYVANLDWGFKNWYFSRNRESGEGFHFHSWDAEKSAMNVHADRTDVGAPGCLLQNCGEFNSPAKIYHELRANNEFRLLFADHVHRHFFNGGTLYVNPDSPGWDPNRPENNMPAATYNKRVAEINLGIVLESARWGDNSRSHPYTRDEEWMAEINYQNMNFYPQRSGILLNQLIREALYPLVAAPSFQIHGAAQHGGEIVANTALGILPPAGQIYFTLDGTDPRASGGAAVGTLYSGEIPLSSSTRVKARTLSGKTWSALNEAVFHVPVHLRVSELMYNATGDDAVEFIELVNAGTDPIAADALNGLTFTDGIKFTFSGETQPLAPGGHIVLPRDATAFAAAYNTADIRVANGQYGNGTSDNNFALDNGGELLRIEDGLGKLVVEFRYDDNPLWPNRADGGGSSLEIMNIDLLQDANDPQLWRASTEIGGSPGTPGIGPTASVRVNEIQANSIGSDNDAIEFYNSTPSPIDIGGMWLSNNLDDLDRYVIPGNTIVPAGGYLVFDEDGFSLGFGFNGDEGDDVVLVQPDEFGNPHLFIDHVSFGAALPGESFGRWPDESGSFYPMVSATFGSTNSGPRIGPVVISEIMHHPNDLGDGSDPQLYEFIELYNPTAVAVNLAGWSLDGIGYQFPAGAVIGAGQNLVLVSFDPANTVRANAFNRAYGVTISANPSRYFGPYSGRANNAGETLTLHRLVDVTNPLSQVIEDQVAYDDLAPWPTMADDSGLSLQRVSIDVWGNAAESWSVGRPTPGRIGLDRQFLSIESSTVIGEVGKIDDLTHEVQTIALTRTYDNPVVFAQPASFQGTDPVVVRVDTVQSDRFDVFLAEPSNLNGLHNATETVSYLVLEAGSHWLADGTHLEVGTVLTDAVVGNGIASPSFQSVNFTSLFAENPVILSQTQTTTGEIFLSTRQQSVTAFRFEVGLEPEEQFGPDHIAETIGYLALDPGPGNWNEMPIIAATKPTVTDQFQAVLFAETTFDVVPSFFASLASYHGADNSHLRFRNAELNSIEVKIEEDTSLDDEMAHTAENVAYLAIGGQGELSAVSRSLVDSQTNSFNLDVADVGRVLDVDVNLDIIHTRVEELDIFLESPDGTIVELLSDAGANEDNLTATTFDDEAAQSITTAAAPFNGRFQPKGLLRDFAAKDVTGRWRLHVSDDTLNGDNGALLEWSLDIELVPEPGNVNFDGAVDATDIDLLFANVGSSDPTFDLDGNGDVDHADIDNLVIAVLDTRYGDADLDRDVDAADFSVAAVNFNPLGQNEFTGWAMGNFDDDADVDMADLFNVVFNFSPRESRGKTETAQATAVTPSPPMVWSSIDRTPTATRVSAAESLRDPSSVNRPSAATSAVETTDRVFQQTVDWRSYDAHDWRTNRTRRKSAHGNKFAFPHSIFGAFLTSSDAASRLRSSSGA